MLYAAVGYGLELLCFHSFATIAVKGTGVQHIHVSDKMHLFKNQERKRTSIL